MNHIEMSEEERARHEAMHAFYRRGDVKELGSQLWNGLIHPIEYAQKIIVMAAADGLWGEG